MRLRLPQAHGEGFRPPGGVPMSDRGSEDGPSLLERERTDPLMGQALSVADEVGGPTALGGGTSPDSAGSNAAGVRTGSASALE